MPESEIRIPVDAVDDGDDCESLGIGFEMESSCCVRGSPEVGSYLT